MGKCVFVSPVNRSLLFSSESCHYAGADPGADPVTTANLVTTAYRPPPLIRSPPLLWICASGQPWFSRPAPGCARRQSRTVPRRLPPPSSGFVQDSRCCAWLDPCLALTGDGDPQG